MKIQDLRSQFTIFVFLPEIHMTTELKQAFASSGYDAYMFIDQDLLIDRVKEAAPHVIVFSAEGLTTSLSEFSQAVLDANSEVQFVCLAASAQAPALNDYREFNFAQIIEPNENLQLRSLWAVDTICEKLALQYQNESLIDQLSQTQEKMSLQNLELKNVQGNLRGQADNSPQIIPLLQKFSSASTKEEFIQVFINHIYQKKAERNWTAVYFKFLPSVLSFVATQGHEIDLERTKGVGAKISIEEFRALGSTLKNRQIPGSLNRLVEEAFKVQSYSVFPLFLSDSLTGQVEGVLLFWNIELNDGDWSEFLIFQLCYQNAYLKKKVDALEVLDPVTELNSRSFFYLRMEEEISRARRISKPISVVRIAIDKNEEFEKAGGIVQGDLILRAISLLIKKTSRTNDFACRTGDLEISLILPHCSRKGAALRAERLRRTIETHSFSINGTRVTVSSGVSEYPSLCSTGRDLDKTASQALEFIASNGGNKVCLFKPEENFKPDFEVSSV